MGCRNIILLLLSIAACRRTEVVIGIAPDLDAPGQINQVVVQVFRLPSNVEVSREFISVPGAPRGIFVLPGSFGVESSAGDSVRSFVKLTGCLVNDPTGNPDIDACNPDEPLPTATTEPDPVKLAAKLAAAKIKIVRTQSFSLISNETLWHRMTLISPCKTSA